MRLCKICAEEKPFDPQGTTPKAKGFVGYVCWNCAKLASNARYQAKAGIDQENVQALRAQRQALQAQAHELRQLEIRAKFEAIEQAKESNYAQWQKAQKLKNQARLAKQDKEQVKLKAICAAVIY